ncbi:MAG: hypothetical protein HKN14_04875 [Marinicaulis sp.]|nr:hypothetical protein [Marinicaulis sp.]
MKKNFSKKLALAAAASSLAIGLGATASAGGYYGHAGYSYYGHGGYYSAGYRHGHRGHHRRHRGGGKGAAIALGVIGGAILLSEAAKASERDRIYRERYEDRYYDRYDRYRTDRGRDYDRDTYRRGYEDGLEADELPEGDSDAQYDSDLDQRLEGAGRDNGPEPIRYSAAEAFQACTKHARQALAARDFILAAPAEPETAEGVGGAWKMTATVRAENQRGESWSRAMYCEADERRVYLLELI